MSAPVELRAALPFPVSILGTLGQLIGAAWPEATMHQNGRELVLTIPDEEPLPVLDADEGSRLREIVAAVRAVTRTFESAPAHDETVTESTEEAYDRGFAEGHNEALAAVAKAMGDD